MKRWLVFGLVVGLAGALAGAVSQAPKVLAQVDAFRIDSIQLRGNLFLSPAEATRTVAVSPTASVWDDLDPLEERLRAHPLVADAKVRRRFPATLVLEVTEETPVALVSNPTLEPVDATGRFLPIDPAEHPLDLPIITITEPREEGGLSAAERRLVAGELARMAQADPDFLSRISEVALDPRGDLWAQLWRRDDGGEIGDFPITFSFRPNLPRGRVQEGIKVLGDAMTRFEEAVVVGLDLRYEDQVVVRIRRAEGN